MYPMIKKLYENVTPSYGLGTFRKFQCIISDYYEGTLHSANFIMYKGKCIHCHLLDYIADFRIDNKFMEHYCNFPSKVFATEEEIERIKNYIVETFTLINFEDGLFNVDFIYTDFGMKIIDFNPRVPNWYHNEYINKVYGMCSYKVDFICNVNTRFIPIHVPANYFSIHGISYVDPRKIEGFTSEHEFEISDKKYPLDEHNYFSKINVYMKK